MSACPENELLLHALVDGELDAGNVLTLEAHIAACAGCAAELAAIREVKMQLKASPLAYTAPQSLLDRLDAALTEAEAPAPAPRRPGLGRVETWVLGGTGAAIAASFALMAIIPTGASLQSELVDAQARSLEASHLVDVQTSDRHTVKPWFNGKIDFAPPVVDLVAQGYPLVGGRLERIDGRRVAALVFHRQAHVINLFIWPGDAPEAASMQQRDGYNLVRWGQGGLVFWAVSDCDPAALTGFQKDFAAATKS
jgi:anti-sigma factor RsiW